MKGSCCSSACNTVANLILTRTLTWQVDKKVVESIFEDGGNGSTQQSAAGSIDGVQAPPSAPGAVPRRAPASKQTQFIEQSSELLGKQVFTFS